MAATTSPKDPWCYKDGLGTTEELIVRVEALVPGGGGTKSPGRELSVEQTDAPDMPPSSDLAKPGLSRERARSAFEEHGPEPIEELIERTITDAMLEPSDDSDSCMSTSFKQVPVTGKQQAAKAEEENQVWVRGLVKRTIVDSAMEEIGWRAQCGLLLETQNEDGKEKVCMTTFPPGVKCTASVPVRPRCQQDIKGLTRLQAQDMLSMSMLPPMKCMENPVEPTEGQTGQESEHQADKQVALDTAKKEEELEESYEFLEPIVKAEKENDRHKDLGTILHEICKRNKRKEAARKMFMNALLHKYERVNFKFIKQEVPREYLIAHNRVFADGSVWPNSR